MARWIAARRGPLALMMVAALVAQACVSVSAPPTTNPAPVSTTSAAQATAKPTSSPTQTATQAPTQTPAQTPGSTPPVQATATPSGTTPPATSTPSSRPTFSTVQDAYNQTVDWQSCQIQGVAAECATVYVPTSYDQPSLGTTAIAVAQFHTASAPQGHLFVNPGGPGSPGLGFAAYLTRAAATIAGVYDIVGFDPRGTGQSDPLVCLDTAQLDALNAFDPTPDNATERQQGIDMVDAQGQACEQNSGLLADHVTTIETARDMDVLRAVIGDQKMDYFGFSYGTLLGTTYAALFPDKVDRFVLDGAVVPNLSTQAAAEIQTQGFQTAVTAYIKDCIKHPFCPLGSTADGASTALRNLLVSIDSNPLPTSDPARPLTQGLAFYGIVDTMYTPTSWPNLSNALSEALAGNGAGLLALSDDYFDRVNGQYTSTLAQANTAISCLDEEVSGGPTVVPESQFVADSPIFGDIFYGLADRGCGAWPPKTTLTPPDYSAPGTPPILVIGTTRDPATPLVWAQELAKTLSNGVLMTRNGDGHTAFLSGNRCIVQNVDDFFIAGTVPANNTAC